MNPFHPRAISRRAVLKAGGLLGTLGMGAAATPTAGAAPAAASTHDAQAVPSPGHGYGPRHGDNRVVGSVDHERNGFDPWTVATEFDFGNVSQENGRTVREFTLTAMDKEIEIAPGIMFPAWVYNGRVPGPTLRCVEGERLRIRLLNAGTHPHSIHFHGIHSARMDGVAAPSIVEPGGEFVDQIGPPDHPAGLVEGLAAGEHERGHDGRDRQCEGELPARGAVGEARHHGIQHVADHQAGHDHHDPRRPLFHIHLRKPGAEEGRLREGEVGREREPG